VLKGVAWELGRANCFLIKKPEDEGDPDDQTALASGRGDLPLASLHTSGDTKTSGCKSGIGERAKA